MQKFKSIFKFSIILMILLFTLSAVSAEDVNDTSLTNEFEEVCINENNEIKENQILQEEIVTENVTKSDESYLVKNNSKDYISLEYSDNINEEIENTHLVNPLNDIVKKSNFKDMNSDITLNPSNNIKIASYNNFYLQSKLFENNMVKPQNFKFDLIKFENGLKNVHLIDHDILIYDCEANINYIIDGDVIFCSDKNNTDFAYSIDNSIIANKLCNNFNKSFFISFNSFFPIFQYSSNFFLFKINFYLIRGSI